MKKDNKHCSRCGCLWLDHPSGAIDGETFVIVRIMMDKNDGDCKCKKFKPMDNLEFLEWLDRNERPN
jgi:hypothetical protein